MNPSPICLVIPTRNRPHFLDRLLRYLGEQGAAFPVFVADASQPSHRPMVERVVAASALPGLVLLKAEYEDHWAPRIVEGLERADTPFALLCGDDDFVVPETISRAVDHLRANSDCAIAHGSTLVVDTTSGHLVTRRYRQRTVGLDDAGARVIDHLSHYAPTFYSVHRRAQLIRNLRLTYEKAPDYLLGEILPSTLSVIQGKAQLVDGLMTVRQDWPTSTGKLSSLAALMVARDFSERLDAMKTCLIDELELQGLSRADGTRAVDAALTKYFQRALAKEHRPPRPAETAVRRTMRRTWTGVALLPALVRAVAEGHVARMTAHPRAALANLQEEVNGGYAPNEMALFRLETPGSPHAAVFAPIERLLHAHPDGVRASRVD